MNRKVDIAWEEIIKKYNILEAIKNDGKYIINAKQIKEFREPRLMTKFDNYESLPYIFKTNKLSILPISRSNFIISTNKIFIELPDSNSSIEHLDFPYYIQSIIPEDITSEAIAINCSYLTGMLEDFLEDEDLFPTVSGRMSSRSFNFEIYNNISKKNDIIEVENSQIEIDGAYEGLKYLSLLEAKKEINSDFLIRQLYYPFRLWESKITKPIKLVFLVHTNGIFSFYEYKFKDKNNYNSLELVKQKNYSLEDTTITTKNIQDILQNVEIIDEPEIPFPQADTFKRVINICELIGNNKEFSFQDITNEFKFDPRQSAYYSNACRYLGLINKYKCRNHVKYKLSNLGQSIMSQNYINRQLSLVSQILEHRIFNTTLKMAFSYGKIPDKNEIIKEMKESSLYKVDSEETYKRRASTIRSWLEWIINLIQE